MILDKTKKNALYIYICRNTGPILESKDIFQKKSAKRGKIFKNLGKNVQNLKIIERGQPHACDS